MIYIPKHKPPSQIRYEKTHPLITFRLDRTLKEHLKRKLKGRSYADFIKECLGAKKREQKISKKEHDKLYIEGGRAGYEQAAKSYGIRVPCAICGEPMVIRSPRKRQYIGKILSRQGWCHPECELKEIEKKEKQR